MRSWFHGKSHWPSYLLTHNLYIHLSSSSAFRKVQLTIEFLLLAKALLFFFTLIYVHNSFIKNPCTCLQEIKNWPREGVIRQGLPFGYPL